MVSSRKLVFLLAFVVAISATAVSAAVKKDVTWYDWYNYGWRNGPSYENWAKKYDDKPHDDHHGWGWGWDWNWGKADHGCWWGCPVTEHYASVYGRVKDDKNRPVYGAKLKVECYHKNWDAKYKKWGVDRKFHSYTCTTDKNGVYSYGRVPTKEYSYKKHKAHFSYCDVKHDKPPVKYTYLKADKKDYKIGYWDAKTWKYDLSDKKRYNGPVYTYKYWV